MKQMFLNCLRSSAVTNYNEYTAMDEENNAFYFANMCHVCHCFDNNEIKLKRCAGCNLISYCGREHQIKDWSLHKDFCKAITQVKKNWKLDNIFQLLKSNNETNKSISTIVNEARARIELKTRLRLKLTQIIKRELKSHEIEIINFPRICSVCFESKPELLESCKNCPQTTFCKKHLDDFNHQKVCPKIMAIYSFKNKINKMPLLIEIMENLKVPCQVKTVKLPNSMANFLDTYIPESLEIRSTILDLAEFTFALLSEKFSRPLSLLFAVERLNIPSGSTMTVHIIGSNMEEFIIDDWEVILHCLPHLSELKLVLISPEICPGLENKREICKLCKENGKKLIIEIKQFFYDEYFYKEDFEKPDIITGYNSVLYAYPTWDETVIILGKLNCPLMITAYNQIEGYIGQENILSKFPFAKCVLFQRNPFASMLYMRSHVDEAIFSKNEFMLLYKDLGSSSV